MPAREEKILNQDISRLAIVAGGGVLPAQLLAACQAQNIQTRIIGIKGSTDCVEPDFWTRIGTSGKTIDWLKGQGIQDIVMIGAVKRPDFFDLWPDWFTAKFFLMAWIKSFGDNSLLSAMRQKLESMGFQIHGVQKFLPELLMPEGQIGKKLPTEQQWQDIQLGVRESQALGRADIGQAVIVKDGRVLGREDKKGTSALIKKYGQAGAILVKTCKPQQDRDLDLPTIGPETVELCASSDMAGIVGQAGHALLVEQELVQEIADNHAIFVVGVTIPSVKENDKE